MSDKMLTSEGRDVLTKNNNYYFSENHIPVMTDQNRDLVGHTCT